MKIIHTEASLGFGGQELRILDEACGLLERGHEVQLICPPQAEIYAMAKQRGLEVVSMPIAKKSFKAILQMRQWIIANQPDIINTHSSTDSWITTLASQWLPQRPSIVRTRHISRRVSKRLTSHWLYTIASDHIVTTGIKLKQSLIENNDFPAEQLTSVRTGVDLSRFKPGDKNLARQALGLAEDKIIIGIVATLRSWKGHRYLLDAFAQLTDKNALQLLIVGDGPQWDALQQQVEELNIKQHVVFAGRQNKVEQYLQAMDIFCLPSYANEGVPQSIMQAQCCGIPTVTTLIGSIDEAIIPEETALVVTPEKVDELTAALQTLINNPDLRSKMAVKAAEHAQKNFSREAMLDDMERIFTQVLEAKKKI
ncbi:MAG: glycosyltransferase [Methyloprofundus sp.]|nr:glycosyltransferase [Methyloprofundus sp.]